MSGYHKKCVRVTIGFLIAFIFSNTAVFGANKRPATRKPASKGTLVSALPEAKDRTLPSTVSIYPGAKAVGYKPLKNQLNRSYLVGIYTTTDPIEKVMSYYKPKFATVPPVKIEKIYRWKILEGKFQGVQRDRYVFRALAKSPALDRKTGLYSEKLTEIRYYMDAAY